MIRDCSLRIPTPRSFRSATLLLFGPTGANAILQRILLVVRSGVQVYESLPLHE